MSLSLSPARVSQLRRMTPPRVSGQWAAGGASFLAISAVCCNRSVFAVYLARIWLLLGVHPHVRQQFVLGVERREFPGAVLQHSRIDCRHSVSLQSSDPKSTLDGIEESLVSVYGGSEAHP